MTVFEYLVGCWKRLNSAKANLIKKVGIAHDVRTEHSHIAPQNPVNELQQASALLEKIRDLIISYAGLTLQEPEMFPQPVGCVSNCVSPITTLMLGAGESLAHLNLLARCCHYLLSPRHSQACPLRIMSFPQQKLSPFFKILLDVSNQTTKLMACLGQSCTGCYPIRLFLLPRAWQEVTLPGGV